MSHNPNSLMVQYAKSKGWKFQDATDGRIVLERCPLCKTDGSPYQHFYAIADSSSKDGLFICMKEGNSGNLRSLMQAMGDSTVGASTGYSGASAIAEGGKSKKQEPLPDIDACHEALLEDEDAMDYLMNGRGFSREIIIKQRIGLDKRYFRECGETRAILFPYLVTGNAIFVHWRTLPTMPLESNKTPKAFSSPTGWEVPLYNGEIIREGLKELILVEGESNVLACLDKGIENIVGVPGANIRKAMWLTALDAAAPERTYICYDKDRVGQKAAQELAARIGLERCWKIKLPDFTVTTDQGEVRTGKDLNEWFVSGGGTLEKWEKLKQDAILFDVDGVCNSLDALDQLEESFEGKDSLQSKYSTPWNKLNALVGFDDGDIIDIIASEKVGKCQPKFVKIKTLTDWVTMGEIAVGDVIASVDGKESIVTCVTDRGEQPVYRVTMSDGRITYCSDQHLWEVGCTNFWRNGTKVLTTQDIREKYMTGNSRNRLYLNRVSGDFGSDTDLPLDPWLLGALIGDGGLSSSSVVLTSVDAHIVEKAREVCKTYHVALVPVDKKSYRLVNEDRKYAKQHPNLVKEALKALGLFGPGKTASHKFIPKAYLNASRATRLALLQGLMDTDGTVCVQNSSSYCTISYKLAKDVIELARSLGMVAGLGAVKSKPFYRNDTKEKVYCSPAYIINISTENAYELFTLPRKVDRTLDQIKEPRLTFESIEFVGNMETRCIMVSHPTRLYITDDYIVTHNSVMAMNLAEHMVNFYKEDALVICLEMPVARMARKWISHCTNIPDSIPKTVEEGQRLLEDMKRAALITRNRVADREGSLYFCYPQIKEIDDMYKLILDCIRRYGVKWVVVDNLQLLADKTLKNLSHRTMHLSQISKTLAGITKDAGIKMIRILQPHRIKEGQITNSDSVDGSSQIAKDCDCMLSLHRNKMGKMSADDFSAIGAIETQSAFEPKMLVTVGLSRYSCGGQTELYFDGATSTVSEFEPGSQPQRGGFAQVKETDIGI